MGEKNKGETFKMLLLILLLVGVDTLHGKDTGRASEKNWTISLQLSQRIAYGLSSSNFETGLFFPNLLSDFLLVDIGRIYYLGIGKDPIVTMTVGVKASMSYGTYGGKMLGFEADREWRGIVSLSTDMYLVSGQCCGFGRFPENSKDGSLYFSLIVTEPFLILMKANVPLDEGYLNFFSMGYGIWLGPKISTGIIREDFGIGLNSSLRCGWYQECWSPSSISLRTLDRTPGYPFMLEGSLGLEVWF